VIDKSEQTEFKKTLVIKMKMVYADQYTECCHLLS